MPASSPAQQRPDPLESALRSAWNQGEPVDNDGEPLVLPADPDQPVPYTVDDTAGKDTRTGASTLDGGVLDLLTAIRDALDVPLPGIEDRDERRFCWLMDDRRSAVYSTLNAILDSSDPQIDASDARYIRRRIEDRPVTYTVWQDPNGGEQA